MMKAIASTLLALSLLGAPAIAQTYEVNPDDGTIRVVPDIPDHEE
jgi:hypothetical protein